MSTHPRLFVATRKGLFTIERRKGRPGARWSIPRTVSEHLPPVYCVRFA
jgi:hypothetical protein